MSVAPLSTIGVTRYHRPDSAFTPIRNAFLRDAQVPLRAFRVGAYVLSHVDGFVQTQTQIARACGLSVTTVRAAIRDLEAARYVASRVIREHGRIIGTAYAVSDTPFTAEELAVLCPPGAESEGTESVHREAVHPKNTSSRRETTPPQKNTPSGGSPAHAGSGHPEQAPSEDDQAPVQDDPDRTQEEPVAPAPTPMALFDAPTPPPARKPRHPSAASVTAAYVDAFRRHHAGEEPLKRDTGRVARDAAAMLRTGEATVEELTAAASAMGSGPYANLGVQLRIYRDRQRPRHTADGGRGIVPPTGHGHPGWEAGAAQTAADVAALVAEDPELAAWLAGEVA